MRNKIRAALEKQENEYLLTVRSLKTLVLGDWNTDEKKQLLYRLRNLLLKNGLYAETIAGYYEMNKKGGLTQEQIFGTCCARHQLIVFIDGTGTGTVTEQNYLNTYYIFQGKVIFFIKEEKFDKLKDNPSEYIKNFPTIITYKNGDLPEKILIYSRLRIYRLAEIIQRQAAIGKGLKNPKYETWEKRVKNLKQ